MKKFLFLVLIIVMLFCSCSAQQQKESVNNEEQNKFVGVWMNYNEIGDLISKTKNENELISEINSMLDIFIEYEVNNIFLHTRAFDDAFYRSDIFKLSKYSFNSNNEFFDFLSVFIVCAHDRNIKVHAWVNPYRISNQNDIKSIETTSYAGAILMSNSKDERVIICDNGIFYNPIYLDIQNYIISGVKEIIENYYVDGIHFDDYFYPTTDDMIDSNYYEEYISGGGTLSLSDLRRNAINSLVISVYSLCKQNNVIFSISPSADILKNYNDNFASIEQWITEYGYVDFIIPQMYYGFLNETMPFNSCVEEWSKYNENNKIILGLPLYKSGVIDEYALSGKNEWIENNNIIARQIQISKENKFAGFAYYSASYLYKQNGNAESEKKNILEVVKDW